MLIVAAGALSTAHAQRAPYLDPSLSPEERAADLCGRLTLEEKARLMMNSSPAVERLGIPAFDWWSEALHGVGRNGTATVYPITMQMASTFDDGLVEEIFTAVSDEGRAKNMVAKRSGKLGNNQCLSFWTPNINIFRDPRWGRGQETYGEDPYLTARMGTAVVRGLQGPDSTKYRKAYACAKHFAVHSGPEWNRHTFNVNNISERDLRETYLPAFKALVQDADVREVMCAYQRYNDRPCCGSNELLRRILRDEWGFDGFIVSDCGAIANMTSRKHYTARNKVEAANDALRAGIATNCGDTYNDKEVIAAAVGGRLDMEALDDVCRDMLRVMFRMGLFENNPSRPLDWNKQFASWQSPEHVALARDMARQSIVLLKNDESLLPLSKTTKTMAVIGPGADNLQLGDYSGKQLDGQIKTVLDGVKASVSPSTKVIYSKGCSFTTDDASGLADAVAAARKADVAIVVLGDYSGHPSIDGEKRATSGENNDLASLRFQGVQQDLLDAVCATGTPVVLVAQIGRPYDLSSASRQTQAILVNWLPGQEGGLATADVLFGDYNPAGRLPMTFPQSAAQLPLNYNFKTSGRRYEYVDMEFYPLYRFGYGLSYTTFAYSNLRINTLPDGNVEVKADVTNTGSRAGDEVAQLYVTDMYASVKTRVMELKGFERLTLDPGQTKTVTFTLTPYDLSLLNVDLDRVVEPGDFKIMVGGMSPDFVANNQIKDSLKYPEGRGVIGSLDYKLPAAAKYEFAVADVQHNLADGSDIVTVKVTNAGNLTDTGVLTMYVDGTRTGDTRHYELDPGLSKTITFTVPADNNGAESWKSLNFVSRHSNLSYTR